jgi:hypothetical protein
MEDFVALVKPKLSSAEKKIIEMLSTRCRLKIRAALTAGIRRFFRLARIIRATGIKQGSH